MIDYCKEFKSVLPQHVTYHEFAFRQIYFVAERIHHFIVTLDRNIYRSKHGRYRSYSRGGFPPVNNLHKTLPVTPPGWVNVWLKMYCEAINVGNMISAIAKSTKRWLMETLRRWRNKSKAIDSFVFCKLTIVLMMLERAGTS